MKMAPHSAVLFATQQVGDDVALWPWMGDQGIDIGVGFDTLRVEPAASAISAENVKLDQGTGQRVTYYLELIQDEHEFREKLHISVSASLKGLAGRGSARLDLYQDTDIHSFDVFLLAHVSVVNGTRSVANPQFNSLARQMYDHTPGGSKRANFVRQYGDTFVASVTYGGELFALFQFSASSAESRQQIISGISGSLGGLTNSFKASVDFERSVVEITKHQFTKLTITRNGGIGPLPPPDLQSLLEAIRKFPDAVAAPNDVQLAFFTQRYARVPTGSSSIIDTEAVDAQRAFDGLADARDALEQRRSDLRFARSNIALFGGLDTSSLEKQLDVVEDRLSKIAFNAVQIAKNRFSDNFVMYASQGVTDLPPPPTILSGTVISSVAVSCAPLMGGPPLEKRADGWYGNAEMVSFCVTGANLPPGNILSYFAHRSDIGSSEWATEGNSTASGAGKAIQGIGIKIEGPAAPHYTVAYSVLTERGNVYSAVNGALAGTVGQYLPIIAMTLQIRIT